LSETNLRQHTRQAADLLLNSEHAVALTGAGCSSPSGIPDFRSSTSGIWSEVDPIEVGSFPSFRYDADKFYRWFRQLAEKIWAAEPNAAHLAPAAMENANLLEGIVTQNVDGLHPRAGSMNVNELHGHLREAVCVDCYRGAT